MKAILDQIKAETEKFQKQIADEVVSMFNKAHQVPPAAFLLTFKDGKFSIGLIDLEPVMFNDTGKDIAQYIVKEACNQLKPFAVAFVSEGWMVKGEKQNLEDLMDDEGNMKVRPMNHPERIETVFINFETHEKAGMQSWKIVREEGKDPYLEPMEILTEGDWKDKKGLKIKGRFSGFLEDMYADMFGDLGNSTETPNKDVKD